jgi:hypothetical protein
VSAKRRDRFIAFLIHCKKKLISLTPLAEALKVLAGINNILSHRKIWFCRISSFLRRRNLPVDEQGVARVQRASVFVFTNQIKGNNDNFIFKIVFEFGNSVY